MQLVCKALLAVVCSSWQIFFSSFQMICGIFNLSAFLLNWSRFYMLVVQNNLIWHDTFKLKRKLALSVNSIEVVSTSWPGKSLFIRHPLQHHLNAPLPYHLHRCLHFTSETICVAACRTVLLMNPCEVPADFLSVAEQLSRIQHSQEETYINLIKHAFQSALGTKYPLQSIHRALQVCLEL